MLYLIRSSESKVAKTGKHYLVLTLESGLNDEKVTAYLWNLSGVPDNLHFKVVDCRIVEGEFPTVEKAKFSDVKDLPEDHPIRKNCNVYSKITYEMLKQEARECQKLFKSKSASEFLDYVLNNDLLKVYNLYPAGLKIHHAFYNGLIQHTYEILNLFRGLYQSTLAKRTLSPEFVVIPALFHDYGKIHEYNLEQWKETEMIAELGHIYISTEFLQRKIVEYNKQATEKLTSAQVRALLHGVIAHHCRADWGSPLKPCTPEALVLHYCDMMSARLNQFDDATHMVREFFLDNVTVIKDYK